MIFPADSPREALMSEPPAVAGGLTSDTTTVESKISVNLVLNSVGHQPPATAGGSDWNLGRAGMMYRDLIPDRIGGKVIASHIKLLEDGPVADYVHYHKVEFQMIYCLKGRIKVVYEDQGPPFWLEAGDCVVQPPEIRHRVLFSEGKAEVLELTMPAEHETWVDHDLELPNGTINKARLFNGQPFVFTKHPKAAE
ncbi:MAG: cupin domain-containing protein [Blastocatellia bacterium]|nr:cupin domain-containing protein [Blastocatellia bacterium]